MYRYQQVVQNVFTPTLDTKTMQARCSQAVLFTFQSWHRHTNLFFFFLTCSHSVCHIVLPFIPSLWLLSLCPVFLYQVRLLLSWSIHNGSWNTLGQYPCQELICPEHLLTFVLNLSWYTVQDGPSGRALHWKSHNYTTDKATQHSSRLMPSMCCYYSCL